MFPFVWIVFGRGASLAILSIAMPCECGVFGRGDGDALSDPIPLHLFDSNNLGAAQLSGDGWVWVCVCARSIQLP